MKVGLYFIFFFLFVGSCTYDNEEELFGIIDCTSDQASFRDHIEPILKANCAISGCHIPGGQIPDFTNISNVQNYAQLIRIRTSDRTMPPANSGKNLSKAEINRISCWVESGAKLD